MKEYRRDVKYYETDRMGIVHNSNYLRFFEEARIDHMRQCGFPYRKIEDLGIIIPVADAYVKFRNPMRFGDEFCVKIDVEEFTGIRIKYTYEIVNLTNGELAATGFSSHCFLDDASRIPVNFKRKYPDIFEILEKNA